MKADVLTHFPYIWTTCTALVLFFTIFVGALVNTYKKSNAEKYKHFAELPLGDDHD